LISLELMLTEEEIARAKEYVEELRCSADGLNLPNNSRTRAAGPCFAIAQEHHHAIIRLFEWRLFAAAFALIRIEFEAYLRGAWLLLCASDSVVETFLQGKEPPKVDCVDRRARDARFLQRGRTLQNQAEDLEVDVRVYAYWRITCATLEHRGTARGELFRR
jgi:hypothetical protein